MTHKRAILGFLLAMGGLAFGVWPSVAGQSQPPAAQGFDIRQPESLRATEGQFLIEWHDQGNAIPRGTKLESITWYYATQRNGADRRRVSSLFSESFSGPAPLNRWQPQAALAFDWQVKRDGRFFLTGNPNAGPITLKNPPGNMNVVVSVLVRAAGIRNDFGLGIRWHGPAKGYEVRTLSASVELSESGQGPLLQQRLLRVTPRNWYWYEIGMRSKGRLGVDVRLRVMDERRESLLVDLSAPHRPVNRALLLDAGTLALWGLADYAEIHVDPWHSRWVDAAFNKLEWDTSRVADGDYFLIAEVIDGERPARWAVSEFQVQVRNDANLPER